jgi:hypothetical protein
VTPLVVLYRWRLGGTYTAPVVEPELLGRDGEREAIGRLVSTARLGVSGTVVIMGEPGVGKTALLEDAVAGLGDMRVLRATGLEAERHIPFAGLLQLLRPALDSIDGLSPLRQPPSPARSQSPRPCPGAATGS